MRNLNRTTRSTFPSIRTTRTTNIAGAVSVGAKLPESQLAELAAWAAAHPEEARAVASTKRYNTVSSDRIIAQKRNARPKPGVSFYYEGGY